MKCDLIKKSSMVGNKVGDVRGNITGRTSRYFHPNIHTTRFETTELGSLSLKLCSKVKRTIDKYGGLIPFLLNISERQLSDYGLLLKNRILKGKKSK